MREQEKQKREIEKDITKLDKESTRLGQALEHEIREVEKTDKQLMEENRQLEKDQKALAADDSLNKTAARLPELRKEGEKLRTDQGLLEGKRAGLKDGKEKLAEGVCPFFQGTMPEYCRKGPP